MGGRLVVRAARQHPDLTGVLTSQSSTSRSDTSPSWSRPLVLGVLAFDGVLSAIAAALFLPLYIGAMPLPISALVSGLVNAALVWAGLHWTAAPRIAALPLWTWLLTVALLTLGGPGNDIVFGGTGFGQYGVLILLILGVAPPAAVLRRHIRLPG